MIAAAVVFWAGLSSRSPEVAQTPREGDCRADPAALAERAEDLLAAAGNEPDAPTLRRARDWLRAARRAAPSVPALLRAADLAFVAGDPEEGGDLLAAAAERSPASLSIPELLWVARRAEGLRRWREAIDRYRELARAIEASGGDAAWLDERLKGLELEAQADAIAPPSAGPSVEARLALADGKRALAAGRLSEARKRLSLALELSPDYAEALRALGAVETRAGHAGAAMRAYRGVLSVEPENVEALTALANLLWEEPDRRAKEESLRLLDRAASLRPDLRGLLRLSAGRWADFGDAPRALERLDRFLAGASPQERAQSQALRDALSRRVRGAPEEPTPSASVSDVPDASAPASAAVDRWKKAQVYLERGGPDADTQALALLEEAQRLDPSFARAPELAAAILQRREDWAGAEAALRRAIGLDASRAGNFESLARLLERDPRRGPEALAAWRQALAAGSTEALFPLAQAEESAHSGSEALRLYRRYRDESPGGARAQEAASAIARLESVRRTHAGEIAGVIAVVLTAGAWASVRRRRGATLAQWLAADPGQAQEARSVIGRLRHEVLKHGGMLLSDGATRLLKGDGDASDRRAVAQLLVTRLYGGAGTGTEARGLLAEADAAIAELRSHARASRVRLNLRHRDPLFRWLLRGLDALRRARGDLERVAAEAPSFDSAAAHAARAARCLSRAARDFALCSGAEMERTVERIAVLPIRVDALRALLARVAAEGGAPAAELEPLGAPAVEDRLPGVHLSALDWETVWRNLFGNALEEGRRRGLGSVRLGLWVEKRRDAVTGEARLRLVLADDLSAPLEASRIRGSSVERGWGVVAEILRRCGGALDVVPAPAPGFTKGIAIELPTVDGD